VQLERGIGILDATRETGGSFSTYFDPRRVVFEPEPAPARRR